MPCPDCARYRKQRDELEIDLQNAEADLRVMRRQRDEARAEKQARDFQAAETVQRIFDHWVTVMGKNPKKVVLGPGRARAVQKMLRLGEPIDEGYVLRAVVGCSRSPWWMDHGKNDLTDICRDEARLAMFEALGR